MVGDFADAVNAVIYLAEGDYENAALSVLAIIPIAGDAATGAKLAMKVADDAAVVAKAGRRGSAQTRDFNDEVRDVLASRHPDARHFGGARKADDGTDIPETYLKAPGGGRSGGAYADLTFQKPDGSFIHVNSVDVKKSKQPTSREWLALEKMARLSGEHDEVYWLAKGGSPEDLVRFK